MSIKDKDLKTCFEQIKVRPDDLDLEVIKKRIVKIFNETNNFNFLNEIIFSENRAYADIREDNVKPSLTTGSVLENASKVEMGCFSVPDIYRD